MKNTTIALVIGRFQPFHTAHLKLVRVALSKHPKVIILIGSYRQARDIHNPFSFEERRDMILSSLSIEESKRVIIKPVRDYVYNDNLWISEIQRIVDEITEEKMEVHLVGHNRDRSSYYLSLFPQWVFEEVGKLENNISASDIRDLLCRSHQKGDDLSWTKIVGKVPSAVSHFLNEFTKTEEYDDLCDEYEFIQSYKKAWAVAPYPPTFVTTDGIILKSGHVLLVRRKGSPGKNLLAFPGGYVKQDETLVDGMIRELKEETAIALSKDILRGSIVANHVFDAPFRDLRGRVVTHGYLINLGSGPLPKVKGGDDASHAFWMPLHEAFTNDDAFFADHWHILNFFVLSAASKVAL